MDYSVAGSFITSPWFTWFVLAVGLWSLPWKGVALWKAARRGHTGWFIALLIFNTMAILEILYIFIFSKGQKHHQEKTAMEEEKEQDEDHDDEKELEEDED